MMKMRRTRQAVVAVSIALFCASAAQAFAPSANRFSVRCGLPRNHDLLPTKTKQNVKRSLEPLRMSTTRNIQSSLQSFVDRLPSSRVIQSVERLQAQGQSSIIASDVASAAGISLSQARRDLTTLAAVSQGDISVSRDGELLYSFPSNLPSALASKSAQFQTRQALEKAWPTLFWGIRVTFGVALLASVVAIFSTIFFITTASSSNSDSDDRRRSNRGNSFGGGGGFGFNYWFGPSPFDVFYYRPYGYYGAYGRRADNNADDDGDMGFLESVFSYIFGDGDPNQRLQERRLQMASQMIRQNQGAVTAEQLAPFCDDLPDVANQLEATYVDEVSVLLRRDECV